MSVYVVFALGLVVTAALASWTRLLPCGHGRSMRDRCVGEGGTSSRRRKTHSVPWGLSYHPAQSAPGSGERGGAVCPGFQPR